MIWNIQIARRNTIKKEELKKMSRTWYEQKITIIIFKIHLISRPYYCFKIIELEI